MPSEFVLDLVFVRQQSAEAPFAAAIEDEVCRLFSGRGSWHTETKREEGLDIAVVAVNGLAAWDTEDDVLDYMDARMQSDCWNWLNGYHLKVIAKEDAGSCRCKKRGSS